MGRRPAPQASWTRFLQRSEAPCMSPLELRASLSLASLFALRMLGLFLILPVFAVHAHRLSGGDSQTLVGMALGVYGLTQAILQIPYDMASDRYGRKRVIVIGLLLFALGSFVAAWASDIQWVILGRAMQGAGAISAPVTAFAADLTREEHRAKAMAIIGGSIGLSFAVSLVAAPALYHGIGMDGIFTFAGALSLAAIWMTLFVVPAEPRAGGDPARRGRSGALRETLRNPEQLRLNLGIFSLHVVQMAIFVVIPAAFVRYGGLAVTEHWKIYLPVVIGSFVLMAPPLVSRIAPAASRGAALGVYNTTQSLGLFVGGALGGWLAGRFGDSAVFVFGIAIVALWLGTAWQMRVPGESAERIFPVGTGADPVALREGLLRLRGVRDAVIAPERGVVRLTVYPDSFDANTARKLIEGETQWLR